MHHQLPPATFIAITYRCHQNADQTCAHAGVIGVALSKHHESSVAVSLKEQEERQNLLRYLMHWCENVLLLGSSSYIVHVQSKCRSNSRKTVFWGREDEPYAAKSQELLLHYWAEIHCRSGFDVQTVVLHSRRKSVLKTGTKLWEEEETLLLTYSYV